MTIEFLKAQFGVDLPTDVGMPSPLPVGEYQWFCFAEYLGGVQFSGRRALMGGGIGRALTQDQKSLAVAVMREVHDQLLFWIEHVICPRYSVVPPKDCPAGSRHAAPGEPLSDFVIALLSDRPEVVSPVPFPPEGKEYWWDWYKRWNELHQLAHYVQSESLHATRRAMGELIGKSLDSVEIASRVMTAVRDQLQPAFDRITDCAAFQNLCLEATRAAIDGVEADRRDDAQSIAMAVAAAIVELYESIISKQMGARE